MAAPRMILLPLWIVVLSAMIESINGIDDCYCDVGCYKEVEVLGRTICCDRVCLHAEDRGSEDECRKLCPCYHTMKSHQDKLKEAESLKETAHHRMNEALKELEKYKETHKELHESRQFIAAIVTPLCLFGVLSLAFVVYNCAKEPLCHLLRKKKKSMADAISPKSGSSGLSSLSHLLSKSKLAQFNCDAEGKVGKDGKDSDSGQRARRRSVSVSANGSSDLLLSTVGAGGGAGSDALLLSAEPIGSARSSSLASPAGLRPQYLEGESGSSSSPSSLVSIPRQPDSPVFHCPFQPLFQPLGNNQSPTARNCAAVAIAVPSDVGAGRAGDEAATLCLRNHGATAAAVGTTAGDALKVIATANPVTTLFVPRFVDQHADGTQNWREGGIRESEAEKARLDSSAYRLASLNINDVRMTAGVVEA